MRTAIKSKPFTNLVASIIILFAFLIPLKGYAGGAVCLYVNGGGEVVCSLYGNSGVLSEADCAAEARASNPACGVNMGAINVAAGSCASAIFGSPNRCLNDVTPHAITASTTQATCEAAGDRWCPSTYYGFFAGNSGCQDAICIAAMVTLPVELINFQGQAEGSDNHITWTTSSEKNNDYFLLEHSIDGENWTIIAQVQGAGNSTEIQSYRIIVVSPETVLNYYRLHQRDFDGVTSSYSPIAIDNRTEKRSLVKVINILGQTVDESYKGIVIKYYDDGTREKTYQ